jgi:glutamate--cysteine ligase
LSAAWVSVERMTQETLRSRDEVEAFIAGVCFKTGPPQHIGIESEWLVVDVNRPGTHVPPSRTQSALSNTHLPNNSSLTFEPGGQFELSTICRPSLGEACQALRADLRAASRSLSAQGLALQGLGSDPTRPPRLFSRDRRYQAMATYFSRRGPDGVAMMASTAATQVCLDSGGSPREVAARWRRAHALVPLLAAVFANSRWLHGHRTRSRSARLEIWSRIDATRTRAVGGDDPLGAWAAYALAAPVMVVRSSDGHWTTDPGFTFEEWMRLPQGPTPDDLAYHLTTLFPPVRPQAWLEIRCIDALPDHQWPVAVAFAAVLLDHPQASDLAEEACQPLHDLHLEAARGGLSHPALAQAARTCGELVVNHLHDLAVDPLTAVQVEEFLDSFTMRGRCPADLATQPAHNGVVRSSEPLRAPDDWAKEVSA